jgi:hypothetical protein
MEMAGAVNNRINRTAQNDNDLPKDNDRRDWAQ